MKGLLVLASSSQVVGEIAIEDSAGDVTVSVKGVAADRVPEGDGDGAAAAIVVDDVTARGFRNARLPPEVVTVANDVLAGVQVVAPVMSRELPLLKVPVAVMRPTVSLTSVMAAGEMEIAVKLPPVALRLVVALTPPRVAPIVVVPCVSAVAVPLLLTIVAQVGFDELQATRDVISAVVLLE